VRSTLKALGIVTGVVVLVAGLSVRAEASTLFYNGDLQGGANASWINNSENDFNQIVFDDFTIGSGLAWNITSVFGQLFGSNIDAFPSELSWEIREGMVAGSDVGTVVASGSGAYSLSGNTYTIPITPLDLLAGTYWLGIYADMSNVIGTSDQNGPFIGVGQTNGLNGVNPFINGAAIWLLGADANNVGGDPSLTRPDFSYGVNGTATRVVAPEPGTIILLATGLAAFARRRRRAA
jgi:hypothetical protein